MKIFFSKQLSDEEVINGCVRGDTSCLSLLYHRTSYRMMGLCLRYFRDRATAEDVMQEGYLKLYKSISQYRGDGNFDAWQRRIFVSACLEEYRKNKVEMVSDDIIDNDSNYADNLLMENISAKELLEMIQNLSDGYRAVFNLYAIEGYTHGEISEMLGISESTSKSQLSRARTLLKAKINSQNKELLNYAY